MDLRNNRNHLLNPHTFIAQKGLFTKRKIQFNIAFVFAITTMAGTTFALLRYFNPYLVLPVVVVPIAFTVELLTNGIGTWEPLSRWSRSGRLSMAALLSALLAGLSFWSVKAGYPSVAWPLPFLSVILAMSDFPLAVILGLPAVAFIATVTPSVWFQHEGLPIRVYFLLIASTIATIYWFISGWNYAIQFQSQTYAIGVATVNLLALSLLWIAALLFRNSSSFTLTLGFVTALFAWLFTAAFPWMGELP